MCRALDVSTVNPTVVSKGRLLLGVVGGRARALEFEPELIRIAPEPHNTGFERADERMLRREQKCLVACRPGELSQQPMCPQVWHIRRWTQEPPAFRHSTQPSPLGATSRIWSRCVQSLGMATVLREAGPMIQLTSVESRRPFHCGPIANKGHVGRTRLPRPKGLATGRSQAGESRTPVEQIEVAA